MCYNQFMMNFSEYRKLNKEELSDYLHFRKRAFIRNNKRGKGSYSRKCKHKDKI